jgi:uncharacterized protein YebE (UPF0316 family)
MTMEEERKLYEVWFFTRLDHHLDFPAWLRKQGYGIQSFLMYEDEASQTEWLRKQWNEIGRLYQNNGEAKNGVFTNRKN